MGVLVVIVLIFIAIILWPRYVAYREEQKIINGVITGTPGAKEVLLYSYNGKEYLYVATVQGYPVRIYDAAGVYQGNPVDTVNGARTFPNWDKNARLIKSLRVVN